MRQSASAVSMPHVETRRFACAAASIDPLTSPGTIQSGLASIAVPELEIWRSFGKTGDAALGHGHDVRGGEVLE
jgi:hypothetical protein